MVFLSRIHPKKGLIELLEGLCLSTRSMHLSIVGPVEDKDYWDKCRTVITRMPSSVEVKYDGIAERSSIESHFWNADCMVLLTAGENYGHVLAESLQAGCPVITTPTTPWTNVIQGGGGEIVSDSRDPVEVAAVLDRWARLGPEQLAATRRSAVKAFAEFESKADPNVIELALDYLAQGV